MRADVEQLGEGARLGAEPLAVRSAFGQRPAGRAELAARAASMGGLGLAGGGLGAGEAPAALSSAAVRRSSSRAAPALARADAAARQAGAARAPAGRGARSSRASAPQRSRRAARAGIGGGGRLGEVGARTRQALRRPPPRPATASSSSCAASPCAASNSLGFSGEALEHLAGVGGKRRLARHVAAQLGEPAVELVAAGAGARSSRSSRRGPCVRRCRAAAAVASASRSGG